MKFGKTFKVVDYSESIVVYDIIVGIYSKLNEHTEIYMYQRSRSFFDICPRSLRMKLNLGERYRTIGHLRPTLNICWFAVLLPIHQNWPYPNYFITILRKICFSYFCSNSNDRHYFQIFKSCIFNCRNVT